MAEARDWEWAKRQVMRYEDDSDQWLDGVELLDRLASHEHLRDLESLLDHDSFCVREAAATPYARLAGVAGLPRLLRAYDRGREDGHDNDGLSADITDLVTLHKAEAAEALARMLRSRHAGDRAYAAWLWGYAAPEVPANPMLDALHDPDAEVRGNAAGSLSEFDKDPRVLPALIEALKDSEPQVRVDAASALGYLGNPLAVGPLKAVLRDPDEKVRHFAEYAIDLLTRSN